MLLHSKRNSLGALTLAATILALGVPTADAAGRYDQLDPWAYNIIHASTQSAPQMTDRWAANAIRSAAPPAQVISENSAGQHRNSDSRAVATSAATSVHVVSSDGFAWDDAGVGAGVAFASLLLIAGVARALPRRNRTRLAGS